MRYWAVFLAACGATTVAAQTTGPGHPSAVGARGRFGHMMAPDDYFSWKELSLDPSTADASVLVLACGSKPDIDANRGKRLSVTPAGGGYLAMTFAVKPKNGIVRIAARAGTKAETGLPLLIVGAPAGTELDPVTWLAKLQPCDKRGRFADTPVESRFAGWEKFVGRTIYSETGQTVFDFDWFIPGRVLWSQPRVPGKGRATNGSGFYIFDEFHGSLYVERAYGNAQPEGVATAARAQTRVVAYQEDRKGTGGGGLLGVLQGAVAGAAGMASGGGGYGAAIAGAAAGAVAGAAGVDAGSIQTGFRDGAADVNARNAAMEAQMAVNTLPSPGAVSGGDDSANGAVTVATSTSSAPSTPRPVPVTPAPSPAMANSAPTGRVSAPNMCTMPGGSREWSTGGMVPLADARRDYEQEATFQRARGSSMGPLQCGKTITALGMASAACTATITWPAKSSPCGSTVSPQ